MNGRTGQVVLVVIALLSLGGAVAVDASGSQTPRVEHFFAVDVTTDDLLLVDKATAFTKPVATVPPTALSGLAYDHDAVLIYAVGASSRALWTIDPTQGWATTFVGQTGIVTPHAAAIDPSDGQLYVLGGDNEHGFQSILYLVSKATGSAVALGHTGFEFLSGLDFDPISGVLYGARSGPYDTGVLVTIDTVSGQATQVASTPLTLTTISFDENGTLYGVNNGPLPGQDSQLYVVDKATGATTSVGSLGVDNVLGAVFDSTIPTPVEATSWGRVKALFRGGTEGSSSTPLSN